MGFLKPDKTVKISVDGEVLTIKQKIIPDNLTAPKNVCSWVRKGQKMKPCAKLNGGTGKPRGITVHNTEEISTSADTSIAEQYARATYNGNMGGVVVHFYVSNNAIWQLLDETERGWHSTDSQKRRNAPLGATYSMVCGNTDTIAIECIGKSAKSEETTEKLVAYLCKKYKLKPNVDVYTHNFFYPQKYCPEYILPHWDEFINNVQKYYNTEIEYDNMTNIDNGTKNDTKDDTDKPFNVQIVYKSGVNVRNKPNVLSKKNGVLKYGGVYTISKTEGAWGYLNNGMGWISIKNIFVKKV